MPFFPPKLGENLIWKEIPNLGIAYSQCFYTENMAGNLKGNYDAKFLEAIGLAFKKCQFHFVPKAEQVQAIHAVVTGNDVKQQDLASLFATLWFLLFVIFFDPCSMVLNQSFEL